MWQLLVEADHFIMFFMELLSYSWIAETTKMFVGLKFRR